MRHPGVSSRTRAAVHPAAGYRRRGSLENQQLDFNAPERWHEPTQSGTVRYVYEPAGKQFFHPVTVEEVRERLANLPARLTENLEVVQFSAMTAKRHRFPCYGMQWGTAVYLYPIEESLVELSIRPPTPAQLVEARMYGGVWSHDRNGWRLTWTLDTIRDFYLNNVLIHEVGHLNDPRNTNQEDRERYANWFAIEHGYRASRGRR